MLFPEYSSSKIVSNVISSPGSNDWIINGECVAHINCTFGKSSFRIPTILLCHVGCKLRSNSSITTIPGVCFSVSSSRYGLRIHILVAISVTILITLRYPSLNAEKFITAPSEFFTAISPYLEEYNTS